MKHILKRCCLLVLVLALLCSAALYIGAEESGDSYPAGDVNGDGVVDLADVMTLRRYLNGDDTVAYRDIALDISNNGVVDEEDLTLLRQFVVGGYGVELKPNQPAIPPVDPDQPTEEPDVPPVEPEEPFDNSQMILRLRAVSQDIKDNELCFLMEESAYMMYYIKLCVDEILLQYDTVGITEEINKNYLKKYYSGYEGAYVDEAKSYFMIIKNDSKKKATFQDEISDMRAGTINWLLDAFDVDKSEILG